MSADSVITVSLVEDNEALAGELQKWIARTRGLRWLATYPTGEAALAEIPRHPPHVVLVDLRLPGMSGVDLIRRLRAACPEAQCLVLTMYAENELIFEALKAGACGYLLKHTTPSEIAAAIRHVHSGGSVMTPRIARQVLEMFTRPAPRVPPTAAAEDLRLNDREQAVLRCMAAGQPRKQIVDALQLNSHTLDYIIRCIYRKLHVNCAAAAVAVAVREGLVPGNGEKEGMGTAPAK
ncbi:MAG: response regulator [Limisphaerales bacterium]